MRPNKFQNLLNNAILHRVITGENSKFDKPLLLEMKRMYKRWARQEDDHRSGVETYGYSDDESIKNNLFYISDRWRCAFRLRWLIDGLENNHI